MQSSQLGQFCFFLLLWCSVSWVSSSGNWEGLGYSGFEALLSACPPFMVSVCYSLMVLLSLQPPLSTQQSCPAQRPSRACLLRAAANLGTSWRVPSLPTSRNSASDHLRSIQR